MAQQNRPKGGASKKLPRDRRAEALVPDPTQQPPDSTVLQGWVGDSTDPIVIRLYLTPDMRTYVEIPEADVLHSHQLTDDQGSLVWVPSALKLVHHSMQSTEVQANFLQGAIAQDYLPGASIPGVAARPGPIPTPPVTVLLCHPTTNPQICFHTQLIACHQPTAPLICFHSQLIQCPPPTAAYICFHSQVVLCPSQGFICHTRICPSTAIPCQSLPLCPSAAICPSGLACSGAGGNLGGGQ